MQPWLLLSYALLSTGVWMQNGTYAPAALILVLASFACLIIGMFRLKEIRASSPWIMWGVLLLFCVLGTLKSPGTSIEQLWFDGFARGSFGILTVLTAAMIWMKSRGKNLSVAGWILVGAIAGAIILRILILWASPSPVIDVWTAAQESASHLLRGSNPYATPISDPYHGMMAGLFATPIAYMYLPVNLLLQIPGFLLTSDVRVMHIVADIILAFVLWQFARRKSTGTEALLLPALWLLHPRGLHLIEQGWTEPMVIALFALSLLLLSRKKDVLGGAFLGLAIGMKQYLVPALLLLPLLRLSRRAIILGSLTLIFPMLVFFLWDATAFMENGVFFLLRTFFRPDSLSIGSPFYMMTGIMLPKATSAIIVLLASGWAILKFKHLPPLHGYTLGIAFSLFAAFLLGAQAFENYYAVVGGFLLLAATTTEASSSAAPSPLRE